jgi:hypothetical protein
VSTETCVHPDCDEAPNGKYAKYCDEHRSIYRRKKARWIPTPAIDAMIVESWKSIAHGKAAALYVRERTGWPIWKVKQRAVALGVSRQRVKEKPWAEEELGILEQFAWMCPDRIRLKLKAAGYSRTATAIVLKRKRLNLLSNLDGYSASKLGALMGEDIHKVTRWIKFGWLHAVRRGQDRTELQGGDAWYIAHTSVYKFVLAHPEEVDLCNVEKLWFLDLATNGKIGVQERDHAA